METRLPLSALLSQALVAFVIEFDNEFEHLVPHRTTNHGSTSGSKSVPWLVSMAMWVKFMQFVPPGGISAGDLYRRTGLSRKEFQTWLTRMSKWWGYVSVGADMTVLPTPGGRRALEVWRPLTAIIEQRWRDRFGRETIGGLQEALEKLVDNLDEEIADSLPILGYDLLSKTPDHKQPRPAKGDAARVQGLPDLLSRALLGFALEYEKASGFSLAMSANVVRLVSEKGVRVRDIPGLAGVSKEAAAMALKRLEESESACVTAESATSRTRVVVLTPKGVQMQEAYLEFTQKVEKHWQASFGKDQIDNLRLLLEQLAVESTGKRSPLFAGLEPYADGWRASLPRREVLPHYPMILHRGGFPDGS